MPFLRSKRVDACDWKVISVSGSGWGNEGQLLSVHVQGDMCDGKHA